MSNQQPIWTKGLSQKDVQKLQQQYGPNRLPQHHTPPWWQLLFKQILNPLNLVLIGATVLTLVLHEYADAVIITLSVAVNSLLGYFQERRALLTLESLQAYVVSQTWVIREGKEVKIQATELVPGDLVTLKPGDKVPADGILTTTDNLWISEAILTGESLSVEKEALVSIRDTKKTLSSKDLAGQIQTLELPKVQQAFMGSTVTAGQGQLIVTTTGLQTKIGELADQVSSRASEATPLELRLRHLAHGLTMMVLFLTVFILLVGYFVSQLPFYELITLATALAVSAIPEGLTIALTALLALTMHRVLQRNGLIKQLMTAETLGSMTTVCVDKTGTLTEGRLQVVDTKLTNTRQVIQAAVLANDRRDPLDLIRIDWASELAKKKQISLPTKETARSVLPFSNARGFVAALTAETIYLVGSPEKVMAQSKLSKTEQQEWLEVLNRWTSTGLRVIAFATTDHKTDQLASIWKTLAKQPDKQTTFSFLGLMALADPVRTSLKQVFKDTAQAGVSTLVITGDHAATAQHVMRALDLPVDQESTVTGNELNTWSDQTLSRRINTTTLFARTEPAQKLRIVEALQQQNEVVGMIGDGVNDAPALSAANIGIAVQEATEVAKEAADLILLKPSFKIILYAIEQGRMVVANLRKIILYLLSDTFSEVILVVASLIFGWPVPLTAAQILWINLIDDGFPSMALTFDPVKDPLKQAPRAIKEPLINTELAILISVISGITSLSLIGLMAYYLPSMELILIRSLLFATLSVDSLLYVFSCRSLEKPLWVEPPWNNRWLILATGAGFLLTLIPLYVPFFQKLLGLTALPMELWLVVFAITAIVMVAIELVKWIWVQTHPAFADSRQ